MSRVRVCALPYGLLGIAAVCACICARTHGVFSAIIACICASIHLRFCSFFAALCSNFEQIICILRKSINSE
ncbi:hypothetical protein HMPREF9248_0291 [Fannyhessea vaginae PB189-T1-4]|uniref:Lipoprotein n=1 Tax=Fannyhessea vaginae PB189-T1-4 TaxID=866774 RepID=A0ABN0B015_9ACTN|nr:hypothetical protein HMPREF9248_0291 [Fannyhessea vaginae PB189-T1-4]